MRHVVVTLWGAPCLSCMHSVRDIGRSGLSMNVGLPVAHDGWSTRSPTHKFLMEVAETLGVPMGNDLSCDQLTLVH